MIIAPSILSADFSILGKEIAAVERAGADWIHIDVMDGHFVPNITIGPVVVKSIRNASSLPFDVHLMIIDPERYIDAFIDAGADIITIHREVVDMDAIERIKKKNENKEKNCKFGMAINPSTPLNEVEGIIDEFDLLLVMTVEPGFGGQPFIEGVLPKIAKARKLLDEKNRAILLEVDGGITPRTAKLAKKAGADVLVAGSAIFGNDDYEKIIGEMRE